MNKISMKIASALLSLVLTLSLFPYVRVNAAVVASGECGDKGDNVKWDLDDSGTLRIFGEGAMKDYPFINISTSPNPWGNQISDIVIGDKVTHIGDYAFFYCDSITNINIPSSVTSIGNSAFFSCSNLTSIDIPSSVTSIGESAFDFCTSLTSIEIPASVTLIGDTAFANCTSLTSIEIPASVTSIGDWAFFSCSNLTSIDIPSSVTSIGDNAFANCTSLTSIDIPSSVTSIGESAFDFCTSLTSIEIPASVTLIGDTAFANCTSLTSIEIPASVTSIGDWAFFSCSNLTSIELPSSLTSIGYHAFHGCTSLTSIEIPIGVTSIGDFVFCQCTSLTSIEIPEDVTSIGESAFEKCTSLTSIEIPASVTSIGYGAFMDCTSLEKIVFWADTPRENYSSGLFGWKETQLKTVVFTKDFSNSQFGNALVSYILPNLENKYFIYDLSYDDDGNGLIQGIAKSYETDVVEFTVTPNGGYEFDKIEFTDNLGNTTELKPVDGKCTMPASETTATVKVFFKRATFGSFGKDGDNLKWEIDDEGSLTVSGTGDMEDWLFSYDRINSAPWRLFQNDIKTVIVKDGVTSIGDYAFSYCSGIESVTIADSVTSVGTGAFTDCEKLATVTINKGLHNDCDKSVFENCDPKIKFIYYEYDITYADATNGTVSGAAKACDTDKVDLTLTPAHNYAVDTVTVTDKNNKDTTLTPDTDGKYSFVMPRSEVTVTATFEQVKADVTFCSEDCKTVYETKAWDLNTTPSYSGTPSKEPDAQYTYTFYGWTDGVNEYKPSELPAVTKDVTYKAVFESTVIKYEIRFQNESGTELQTLTVAYGDVPAYSGVTPTKEPTTAESYAFSGWTDGKNNYSKSDVLPAVTGKVTYTALFTAKTNEYTVKFVKEDGTEVSSVKYPYGTKAADIVLPAGPEKEADKQYTYTFAGWGEIKDVTGDATYKASYTETVNKYTVTFKNYDGNVLSSADYDYGTLVSAIVKPADPTKPANAQYTYKFKGWTPVIANVTDDATYTATYTETVNKYTVTFKDYDGKVITSAEYDYGTGADDVVIPADPAREGDAQFTYAFAGWDKDIADVVEDVTYTAKYSSTVNEYTVKFVKEDGTEISSKTYAYGTTASNIAVPAAPVKEADKQYTYTFKEWSPAITTVTGNATYKATYSAAVNKYKVTFVNYDGKVLSAKEYDYGTLASAIELPADPAKPGTAQYSYAFAGWDKEIADVKDNVTYTAKYTETVNEYTIKFVNEDGTVLQSSKVAYGETPAYTGTTPSKAATAQYTYTFKGWDKTIEKVTGDATYTATYTGTVNEYTVKFVDEDGTELSSATYSYGTAASAIVKPADPVKQADAQYTYTFAGWTPAITNVTGDATYTAKYTKTVNEYTVKFVDEDGTVLQSSKVAYGTVPTYSGAEPAKAETDKSTFVFSGWNDGTKTYTDALPEVTGDVTYKAVFTEAAKPDPTPATYYLKSITDDSEGNKLVEIERLGDEEHTIDYYDKTEGDAKKLEEGKEIDVYSGSVIIKLRKSYLDTLSEGKHTLKVYFKDGGEITVEFTVEHVANTPTSTPIPTKKPNKSNSTSSVPATGELIGPAVFIGAALILAACGVIGAIVIRKRKEEA